MYTHWYRECSVREQFRIKWKQVIDEMERFRPEFVIFSAGFDAHDEDPLASCDLLEEDFKWATEIVLDACHRISPEHAVPVMSILEGGYDIPALTGSAVAHVLALVAGSPAKRKALKKAAKLQAQNPVDDGAKDCSLLAGIHDLIAECDAVHLQATEVIHADKQILESWNAKSLFAVGESSGVPEVCLLVQNAQVESVTDQLSDLEIAEAVLDALGPSS
jgi:hypothetical protein